MIAPEFEYLFEENGYKFYQFEEYGFSHTELGMKYRLYEEFGYHYTSTFQEIFEDSLYYDRKISQVWIFYENQPVGLGMAIHYTEPVLFTDAENDLSTNTVGHIQVYVKPRHRKKGLASKMISPLENFLIKVETSHPSSVILQDKAYNLKSHLNHLIALPHGEEDYPKRNIEHIYDAFKNISDHTPCYQYLKNNFPTVIDKIQHLRLKNVSLESSDSLKLSV